MRYLILKDVGSRDTGVSVGESVHHSRNRGIKWPHMHRIDPLGRKLLDVGGELPNATAAVAIDKIPFSDIQCISCSLQLSAAKSINIYTGNTMIFL